MQKMYAYTTMLCLPVVLSVVVSTAVVGRARSTDEEWNKHMARKEPTVVETGGYATQSRSLWKHYLLDLWISF